MANLLDSTPVARIPDFPATVPAACVAYFQREMFVLCGRLLDDAQLRRARFAYERVWEANPMSAAEQDNKATQVTGHRSVRANRWSHEADLLGLIASPFVLAVAEAALGSQEIVWVGGFLHRHRLLQPWQYSELGWNGWHKDAPAAAAAKPIGHVNVWFYLDDCGPEDGVTQVMPGSVPRMRELLAAGEDAEALCKHAQSHWHAPDWGVHCPGVAGAGFLWTGPLLHRITPNVSGRGRRLVTLEFGLKPADGYKPGFAHGDMTLAQIQALAPLLPAKRHYLLGL